MKKTVLALAAISLLVTGAAEALTIDQFDAGDMALTAQRATPPPIDNQYDAVPVSDVLGGARKLWLTDVSGTTERRGAKALVHDGGFNSLSVSNDDGVNSVVTVVWDGNTTDPRTVLPNGLNNTDLTVGGGTAFLLSVDSIDTRAVVDLTVWADGKVSAPVRTTFPDPTKEYRIPFSLFTGIDFQKVGAIQMVLSGPNSWDGSVLLAKTDAPVPATLALMAIGLLGLSRTRRCR